MVTWIFHVGRASSSRRSACRRLLHAPEWSPRNWALLAYIVAVPTILQRILANAWALARSARDNSSRSTSALQPILTALLAHAQLGETLKPRLLESAALILVGVTIVAATAGVTCFDAGVDSVAWLGGLNVADAEDARATGR